MRSHRCHPWECVFGHVYMRHGQLGLSVRHLSSRQPGQYLRSRARRIRAVLTRFIRLVLTGTGPTYLNADAVTEAVEFRRVRNLYYTRDFAEVLYREAMLYGAKATRAARAMPLRHACRCR